MTGRASVVRQPEQEPDHEHDGNGKDGSQTRGEQRQEEPVAAGMPVGFAQVPLEEEVVSAIRLPENVKDVAEDGDGSDEDADAQIGGHARERDVRDTANPRGKRNDEREHAGDDIAETGNEADDSVEPEAEARAGDAKRFIEQDLEPLQGLIAEDPCAAVPAIFRISGRLPMG